MPFVVVGVSHRTAPVEVRERFAFAPAEVPDAIRAVLECPAVSEVALISTCNRTEFYFFEKEEGAAARVRDVLARQVDASRDSIDRHLYELREDDVVRHLYRVASGLDSMVLGEVQIQGQVRDAYEAARSVTGERRAVGALFNRLFQSALSVGSRVRTETRMSEGAASVPSAAVELALKIFGSLRGRRGMVLGAGEMGELTLRCLVDAGMEDVIVASRNHDRARTVAETVGGRAVRYDDLWAWVADVDVLITSTGAPHPVLTADRFRRVVPEEPKSPLFIIDIAMPRDVEPMIGDHPNVFLYSIDDLEQVVAANVGRREEEIPRAERIIDEAVDDYWSWYAGLAAVPLIRRLRGGAEELRRAEVEGTLSGMDHLSEEDRDRIERMTRTLLNKFLHDPTTRLKEAAGDGRNHDLLEAARYLFRLEEGEREDEPEG